MQVLPAKLTASSKKQAARQNCRRTGRPKGFLTPSLRTLLVFHAPYQDFLQSTTIPLVLLLAIDPSVASFCGILPETTLRLPLFVSLTVSVAVVTVCCCCLSYYDDYYQNELVLLVDHAGNDLA